MKRIIDPTKSFPNLKILGRLSAKMSGSVWDGAEKDLFEYNKTIITLSSSALVLSFTVIRLGNISLNKVLIGSSWTLFLLVILSGVLIQFSKFLYRLTDEVVKQGSNDGGYKKGELFSELEIPGIINRNSIQKGKVYKLTINSSITIAPKTPRIFLLK